MKIFITAVGILVVLAPTALARKWTDATGTYTVEARLLDFVDGKVRLKKEDGSIIRLPLEKLSQEDQRFIQATYVKRKEKERAVDQKKAEAGRRRVPMPRAAAKQLDEAMVEGIKATHSPATATRPGEVIIFSEQSAPVLKKGKQETLEITINGEACKISHNWKWKIRWEATTLQGAARGQYHVACPPPSGSIRLTALTDLPLDGVTVSAGSVLIRNGRTWDIIQERQEGTEPRNDATTGDAKAQEHGGAGDGRSKPQTTGKAVKPGRALSERERYLRCADHLSKDVIRRFLEVHPEMDPTSAFLELPKMDEFWDDQDQFNRAAFDAYVKRMRGGKQ